MLNNILNIDISNLKLSTIINKIIKKDNHVKKDINTLPLHYYFPYNKYINFTKLYIDNISKYSITLPKKANSITKIILSNCIYINLDYNCKNIIITDATAGVGGNVLSFCKYNMIVNAVEIDKTRYKYLNYNINNYNYCVNTYNNNYIEIYDKLIQDIIFIDPPWGGMQYKQLNNIRLSFCDSDIEDFCNNILKKNITKMIVLKLPYNYDLNYIKLKIKFRFKIVNLKNIILLLIFNH